jgi:hypothetical protein
VFFVDLNIWKSILFPSFHQFVLSLPAKTAGSLFKFGRRLDGKFLYRAEIQEDCAYSGTDFPTRYTPR